MTAVIAAILLAACSTQPGGGASGTSPLTPLTTSQSTIDGQPLDDGSAGFGKYLAAREAQGAADTRGAADYYKAALTGAPDNLGLKRRAYFFLMAEGRAAEAMPIAANVLADIPDENVAPLLLAVQAVSQSDYATAHALLKDMVHQGLNTFMVPLLDGWALAGMGRTDDAMAALAPMTDRPQLGQLHDFHAGLILDQAGRSDEAWTYYQKTLEGNGPLSLRTVQVVTSFLRRAGRADEAEALIERYRTEHPGSVMVTAVLAQLKVSSTDWQPITTPQEGMAEALYGAASSVLQSNAFDTAMVFVRLSMLLRPDFAYGNMMIGDVLANQRRFADAVDVYAAIPHSSPISFPVRLRLSEATEALGRADEAAAILRSLVMEYPQSPDPLVRLGDLNRRQEKWTGAADAYAQAIALSDQGEISIARWALYYSRGVALERANRWPEAEDMFFKALELEPDQPLVLNYLGYSWIDKRINLEEGTRMIEKAVSQRPGDGFIVDSLGWAYFLRGDYDRAVRELERAIELMPSDPTVNDHLGDAYWKVGRTREAEFQWQRALTLDPEPAQKAQIEGKLVNGLPATPPVRP